MMRRLLAALILLLLAATQVPAQPAAPVLQHDTDQPIQITSDRLEAEHAARQVRFIGNVAARQGELLIYAGELIAYLSERQEIERIEALRDVRIIQGVRVATGQKGVYYRADARFVLTGSPRIRQGEDFIEGEEITVFLNEERSIVRGRNGSRVQAVFHPRGENR